MSSSPRSHRNIKAYAYHKGSGTKLELWRVNEVFELPVELVPYRPEYVEEQHFRSVFFTFCKDNSSKDPFSR